MVDLTTELTLSIDLEQTEVKFFNERKQSKKWKFWGPKVSDELIRMFSSRLATRTLVQARVALFSGDLLYRLPTNLF